MVRFPKDYVEKVMFDIWISKANGQLNLEDLYGDSLENSKSRLRSDRDILW